MEHAIIISPRVVERLRFMDANDRRLIFETLISDEILCEERVKQLTPSQALGYQLVRDMIMRDSQRFAMSSPVDASMPNVAVACS